MSLPESSTSSGFDAQWLGRISFEEALSLQESLLEKRQSGTIPDTILQLEHEPVYTIGRTRDRSSLNLASETGIPVVETNRGGQATYHGPGQLVGYLILDLNRYGRDLHRYLRTLEQSLIDGCEELGLSARRRDQLTGVWIENRKIASIGVGIRKWITMHGFALNITEDLAGFDSIIPCGLAEVEMTSLQRELGQTMTPAEVARRLQPHLVRNLGNLRDREE